ncbi:MAG: DUF177 domain-containing protein [Ruminococcus sp.]|nr:DUF177 domain-containing protein [Ruminococcus sp.]
MILKLRRVFEVPGERKDISFTCDPEKTGYLTDKTFSTPINVSGCVVNHAGVVELSTDCKFAMKHECDRCLIEFEREYDLHFEHTLVLKAYKDDDLVVCENAELDVDELVINDILLSLPTKILCRDDCKGLCPTCGKDLNEGGCEHTQS